ncbi:MAG: hypothetical protein ISR90_02145 [Candidatus Marinimicrobia bacterium]|nr:hypothetical protein [Candidatus Neomarinimicrobiota bacterium]MBL7022843.1 hypothetical protein [Candidatus Neomarinimicrobiota bacterium]MBL7109436.1 hypothetical protein [Candidatus Neomarinimicrobiota bacterium]
MKKLIIKIQKIDSDKPEVKVQIPLKVAKLVNTLIPGKVKDELNKENIDISKILNSINELDDIGTLVEVEQETQQIIIAVE